MGRHLIALRADAVHAEMETVQKMGRGAESDLDRRA
jgi:hypothetical protein